MVEAFHPKLLRFLNCLHESRHAGGIEELSRNPTWPATRSIYRWQRSLGQDLIYFPSVAYEALGLSHVHLFIENPQLAWERLPWAVRGRWLVRCAGIRVLYLHCLVPTLHLAHLRDLVAQGGPSVQSFESSDGWQVLGDLVALRTPEEDVPCSVAVDAEDLIERYPLLVPVVCAAAERRASLDALWQDLRERLGARVWDYLPRGVRRTPHNGKQYVRQSLRLLNDAFLFRQHIIRYKAVDEVTIELLLVVRAERLAEILDVFVDAPLVEVYPGQHHTMLVSVSCGLRSLSAIFSAQTRLAITECFFVDRSRNEQVPLACRFAYELLFDPTTCEWRFPSDEIARRLSR